MTAEIPRLRDIDRETLTLYSNEGGVALPVGANIADIRGGKTHVTPLFVDYECAYSGPAAIASPVEARLAKALSAHVACCFGRIALLADVVRFEVQCNDMSPTFRTHFERHG